MAPDFQLLFESVPGLYLAMDPSLVIVAVSDAYLAATGTRREQLIGVELFAALPPPVDEAARIAARHLRTSLERVRDTRAPDAMPVQRYDLPRPDGSGLEERFWSSVNAPVLAGDRLVYIVQRIEDVTEFVRVRQQSAEHAQIAAELRGRAGQMEAEVVARLADVAAASQQLKVANAELRGLAARLEDANRELESFSYSVAHDLRAPLRSIDGFSQALLEDVGDHLDAVGLAHVTRVRAAAQRMARLIDDLLGLARIGRAEMAVIRVDLSALARASVEHLRDGAPGRRVDARIADDLIVDGDPRLLAVLLDNLLANAWKFTAGRDPARIEVFATDEPGGRVYHVRDDGVGFDMAHAGKLFGVFERLHRQDEFPGTGIGLVTVQRIARRHGGRVWADGAVGRGATFHFTLGHLPSMAPSPASP